MKHRTRILVSLACLCTLSAATLIAADCWVGASNDGRIYHSIADIPAADVALVLGANPNVSGGNENLYFRYRIDAAADLYRAGKVRHLLVSGDNHVAGYDEPTAMRDALIARGVPAGAITLDYAGFRTLDSVVRARDVFGLTRFLIVSQEFHNRRALFIASGYGIDATAFCAGDVPATASVRTRMREVAARMRAVLDSRVLGTTPHFEGPPEPIVLKN